MLCGNFPLATLSIEYMVMAAAMTFLFALQIGSSVKFSGPGFAALLFVAVPVLGCMGISDNLLLAVAFKYLASFSLRSILLLLMRLRAFRAPFSSLSFILHKPIAYQISSLPEVVAVMISNLLQASSHFSCLKRAFPS